jgi:CoA:oxalate CoA-transferase
MGVAVADIIAGTHLTQGILAALLNKFISGEGCLVQISMLESLLDFQFEVLTCFFNDGGDIPIRSAVNGAHAYIAAPYGIYKTLDGFIAIAMAPIPVLASLLEVEALSNYIDPAEWFDKRDEIKEILRNLFKLKKTADWLALMEPADMWCADVYDYNRLLASEGYKVLEAEQWESSGKHIKTTRCPARVDGVLLNSKKGTPQLGEHNELIDREFGLNEIN